MDKLQNALKIFGLENNQYTIDDIKKVYRQLASKNHPDKGGNTETMQLINNAFDELSKFFIDNITLDVNQEQAAQAFDFEFINELKNMPGVTIEVCGYWVWLSGSTFPHREVISKLGFKFSGSKKMWYWSPTIDMSVCRRGSKSMKNIRQSYGSTIIEQEKRPGISHQ